jgi:hypothetical protein
MGVKAFVGTMKVVVAAGVADWEIIGWAVAVFAASLGDVSGSSPACDISVGSDVTPTPASKPDGGSFSTKYWQESKGNNKQTRTVKRRRTAPVFMIPPVNYQSRVEIALSLW